MKRRLIAIGLCCSMLCITGCTKETQSGAENVNEESTETGNTEIESIEIDEPATEVAPGTGEGTSSAELADISESSEHSVGENITISFDNAEYELQIDAVSYLDAEAGTDDENIVVLDYTYKNLSDDPLLIGDVRFQLADGQYEVVYEPYYSETLKEAEVVEKGKTTSAQIAFSDVDTDEELIVVYTDIAHEEMDPILIRIEEVK